MTIALLTLHLVSIVTIAMTVFYGIHIPEGGGAFGHHFMYALAAASLQARIKAAVEASDGRLASSQVLPPARSGPYTRVRVSVRLTIDNDGLQRLLYELESKPPLARVDNLLVSVRPAPRRRLGGRRRGGPALVPDALDVRLTVSAPMRPRGPPPSAADTGGSGPTGRAPPSR